MTEQQKTKSRPMPLALKAIPISKDLKRYFWVKYVRLCRENGKLFAAKVFQTLRETLLLYVCDEQRMEHRADWIAKCPVRKNGWLRKLFNYADTDPQSVFQFLRLYLCEDRPLVSVEESAKQLASVLNDLAVPQPNVPTELSLWLAFVSLPGFVLGKVLTVVSSFGEPRYSRAVDDLYQNGNVRVKDVVYHIDTTMVAVLDDLLQSHSKAEVLRYHALWQRIMTPKPMSDDECVSWTERSMPARNSYCDTNYGANKTYDFLGPDDLEEDPFFAEVDDLADSWERDINGFINFMFSHDTSKVQGLYQFLSEDFWDAQDFCLVSSEEYFCVGQVHHIPKKGTVKRRAIAVPNRFLQAGLRPMQQYLRRITRQMPRNCQFNQSRLDKMIYDHLQSDYAACVDLSQATDWLPISWFHAIVKEFGPYWFNGEPTDRRHSVSPTSNLLEGSFSLFEEMRTGQWLDGEYFVSWWRGQPLGTWPSFEVLTVTHCCLLEAISWFHGDLSMPYGVLGDDSVFFRKDVRLTYISIMEEAGSPLSLHKSYEGRLVEFAGKYFVRNNESAYSPAPNCIYWTNLFDYQHTAGVRIHFDQLPKKVRRRLRNKTLRCLGYSDTTIERALYDAMSVAAGVPHTQLRKLSGNFVESYYRSEAEDCKIEPHDLMEVTDYSEHFRMFVRFRTEFPARRPMEDWFKQKYRPVTTDALAERCLRHCATHLHRGSFEPSAVWKYVEAHEDKCVKKCRLQFLGWVESNGARIDPPPDLIYDWAKACHFMSSEWDILYFKSLGMKVPKLTRPHFRKQGTCRSGRKFAKSDRRKRKNSRS